MRRIRGITTDDQVYQQYLESNQEKTAEAFKKVVSRSSDNAAAAAVVTAGLKARRLALVLGAGISFECGIPMWTELVDKLLAASVPAGLRHQIKKAKLNEARKMRLLELHTKHYQITLQGVLYESAAIPRKSTLAHAALFISECFKRRALDRVITYNFDDLLQEELARKHSGLTVKTISSAEDYSFEPGQVHIIHPHGHLRRNFSFDESLAAALVFSEPSYHSHFLDNLFWANRAQLTAFSELSCLFVGVSFSDPNHRRLLDATNSKTEPKRVAIMRWNSGNPVANVLVRNDLGSLGVRPYWIKDFREIGTALKELRG